MALLTVENLTVGFRIGGGDLEIASQVSLTLERGRVLGVIGESGSGKTVTSKALLRLLPANAYLSADRIEFAGRDLVAMPEAEFSALRGREMAMIFQDPVGSFNPVKTIGWHFTQVGRRARGNSFRKAEARQSAVKTLKQAGIPHAEDVLGLYPHQLSGGMLQRCLIALVLFLKPSLIVADEPTTNLDNIVERQIIDLFAQLQDEVDAGFIFITHDMTIAERICDDIAVMYAGQVVETAPAGTVLSQPVHPYSQGLIRTARELDAGVKQLTEIPGDPTGWQFSPHRCRFSERCPQRATACDRPIELTTIGSHGAVRCVLAERAGAAS